MTTLRTLLLLILAAGLLAPAVAPGQENTGAPEAAAEASPAESALSLPRRIADFTQSAAEGVVGQFDRALAALSALDGGGPSVDWAAFGAAVLGLAIVVVATVAAFVVLRRLASGLFAAASAWALRAEGGAGLVRRVLAVVFAAIVDVAAIVLAWVGGYAVALFVLGEAGEMATHQSLFLNAFLLIEVFKAAIRMVFASRYDGLRLLPIAAADAAHWNGWLARLVGFVGYGMFLAVPVVNANLSPAVGSLLSPLIMILAFAYAVSFILRNRVDVRARLEVRARDDAGTPMTRLVARLLTRTWHMVAILYFGAITLVTITRPEEALPFMLTATIQTLVAVGVGVFVSAFLGQLSRRPLNVPEETRQKFPQLEKRLNGFIPKGLNVVRIAIAVVVVALVLDAWGVIMDLGEWIESGAGAEVLASVVSVAFIVLAAVALWIVIASWIEHRLNPEVGAGEPGAREKTLLALFRNAIAIVIVTMTLMISLSEIGIDIGPLIAGAGVLGLAIGFGAQKLVQDIITGVFIQLENAINTGDVITVGGISGTAERLSIRSVGIRDLSGTFHIVPFSSVDTVSNYMRGFAYHLGVYGVAYREDVDEVIEQLRAAFAELRANEEHGPAILEDLEVHGVTEFADSAVNVRVRIKTLPGSQWAVGRAYNRLVKRYFDAAGIEIPFPHTTLYFGEDKRGDAPAANVRMLGGSTDVPATEAPTPSAGPADTDPVPRGTREPGDP